jgi:hypothetical protein
VVAAGPGKAAQVNPIKLHLKLPGNKRLKVKYGKLLSFLGFDFNLRCYNLTAALARIDAGLEAGACTRPLLSST